MCRRYCQGCLVHGHSQVDVPHVDAYELATVHNQYEVFNLFQEIRLPIQLIQRMHEQVCSFEVLGAASNAVGSDAIYKNHSEHCRTQPMFSADSSRLRSINSGLNLSPVMYSVN